jgi:endoglucanase
MDKRIVSVSFILAPIATVLLLATGCVTHSQLENSPNVNSETTTATPLPVTSSVVLSTAEVLQQSWDAYRQKFIQADGRVIDWEAQDRTVSEGQAYAMLRAVLADDPDTFALALDWAEKNLGRRNIETLGDQLWVWKWGKDDQGNWGVIDPNFASDADIDAITALIFAARRWNRPEYLELAQAKLEDLWELSTVSAPNRSNSSTQIRYILPGPLDAFQKEGDIYFNSSYLAPYAFRLFAQVDPNRDWMSLVESSYRILEDEAALSTVKLPSDWIALNQTTGMIQPVRSSDSETIQSIYSFDAYRVWWRVAMDAIWFDEPRANQFLTKHLQYLQELWRSRQAIPARIDLQGKALVDYEATAQYAMLYPALQIANPAMAEQILQQKLYPVYQNGIWDNASAYYVQNLAWFGLFAYDEVPGNLLQPAAP